MGPSNVAAVSIRHVNSVGLKADLAPETGGSFICVYNNYPISLNSFFEKTVNYRLLPYSAHPPSCYSLLEARFSKSQCGADRGARVLKVIYVCCIFDFFGRNNSSIPLHCHFGYKS